MSADGRRALVAAQRLARTRDQEAVELEHLLRALLDLPEIEAALEGAGADLATLRLRLEQALRGLPKVPNGKVYLGDRVLRLLDISQVEARERGAGVVSPLHLLVGIPLETRSPAAEVLRDAGLTLPKLEQVVAGAELPPASDGTDRPLGGGQANGRSPVSATDAQRRRPRRGRRRGAPGSLLAKYARDLTAQAAAGKMDPVIGRDAETRRVLQILGRRGKNNPILIGDPGGGQDGGGRGAGHPHRPRGRAQRAWPTSASSAWTWAR